MKRILILLVSAFLIITTNSCTENNGLVILKKKVTYKVTGTSEHYTIRYYDEDGNYIETEVRDDWTYEFKGRADRYLYLSATNEEITGEVEVKIYVRDKIYLSDDNDDPNGIASVSGYL